MVQILTGSFWLNELARDKHYLSKSENGLDLLLPIIAMHQFPVDWNYD